MKKDVVYIDVEDDITAVIDKIKSSREKIIALVPSKGNAVLQSAVNLKLLNRAADAAGKQPVIVTSNHALVALAGGLGMYVAKNLQSKPVLASAPVDDSGDELEVSDSAPETAEVVSEGQHIPLSDAENTDVDISPEDLAAIEKPTDKPRSSQQKSKPKKVPNFDSFRKKLLLGGAGLVVLVVVLLLLFGRASSSVVVRAETTPVDVLVDMQIGTDIANSTPTARTLKAESQKSNKTLTQSFSATGQKDLGTKASGSMTLSIACSAVTSFPVTVPSGTGVSANGLTFVTQSAATLSTPGGGGGCKFSGATTVVAQNNGDQYNLSPRSYTVSGNSSITGTGSQMSGGTSRIVKVVSQSDVDKAREQLSSQQTSDVSAELKKSFGEGVTVLEDSFVADLSNIRSEPAVGQEANEGRLTIEAAYSMLGVTDGDLGAVLDDFVVSQMTDRDRQQVYDNGFDDMRLEKLEADASSASYRVATTGQYGPKFDTNNLEAEIAGKKFGEARSYLEDLPGVKSVDIDLSPFWARTLPNKDRISIKLDVEKQ